MTEPNAPSLLMALEKAIDNILHDRRVLTAEEAHNKVKNLYDWYDVSKRTVLVYDKIAQESKKTLAAQLRRYIKTGVLPWLLVISLMYIILKFLEWYIPKEVRLSIL